MGDARRSGLKEVNSLISPHSKSSSLNFPLLQDYSSNRVTFLMTMIETF
jgi:hypothetical protein